MALICLLLAVMTVAVYWPVAKQGFINFDDPDYVSGNPRVQAGLTMASVQWAFTSLHSSNWHPLTWLSHMAEVFSLSAGLLKEQGYLLSFIGDMYRDNHYHCLSAELAHVIAAIPGMVWKANIVWYDVSKKLHLYGYQYSYIPSMIHQNIIVFRKEGVKGTTARAR